MLAGFGWFNILASVGYALLNHFHLVEFVPVLDATVKEVLPVIGGASLHAAKSPIEK